MAATVATDNFRPLHAEGLIHVSRYGTRDGVKVGRPATAGFELMVCLVEGSVTAGAIIHTLGGRMRIVLAATRSLGALLAQDSELLCIQSY